MCPDSTAEANPNGVPFGLHGGQPPGGLAPIGQVPVLERPASPTDLGSQPAVKKGRSELVGMEGMDCESEFAEASAGGADRVSEPVLMESTGGLIADGAAKVSYAEMAAKSATNPGRSGKNFNYSEVEVVVRDEDCLVDDSGAFPRIQFSEKVHDQIDQSMRNVIIVRLLGKVIGFGALLNRLHALWRPVGEIQLIDLDNDYYLVRFADSRDYAMALTDGPWTIYGSYLIVQPWSRSFSTLEKHPSHVVVWIRLPGLPYRYYCKALFRRIAAVIGSVVKVDYNTKEAGRGKFARIVVLVDLNKPLKSCVGIDNFVQRLEYEGLQNICFGCGVIGHSKEECRVGKESVSEEKEDVGLMGPRVGSDGSPQELYGPWMMAVNRRRRFGRVTISSVGTGRSAGLGSASRFSVLNEEDGVGELPSEAALVRDVPVRDERDVAASGSGLSQNKGVRFNKSYLESNPPRRSKLKENVDVGSKRMEVVSLLEEHPVEAGVRAVSMASGSHVAISVSDKGDAARSQHRRVEGLSVTKGRGKENKGLRFKKGNAFQLPPRAALRDWIPIVSRRIDADAQALRHGLANDFEEMDDDDPVDLQSEGDAVIQSPIPRDRSSAGVMDVGPLQ
ncbi:hypothetical protein GQ457_10G010860 [Hibiscus cannabinus]